MRPDNAAREETLLDFHLDRLEDDVRVWLEAELTRDAAFRAKSDRLGQILRPLDYWTVNSAPPNLADRILARVANSGATAPPPPVIPLERGVSPARRSRFGLGEVIAVAACIALLALVGVPGMAKFREESRRAVCRNNLASIFRGVSLYRRVFQDSLPFAGGETHNASWLPSSSSDASFASNSRHLYLIAKLNYGPTPDHFVCPSSPRGRPMKADQLCDYDDFPRAGNISYASLNLAGRQPNLRPPSTLAFLSDPNPLFVDARFNSSVDPDHTNSPAHGGRGQSVLLLNGTVRVMTKPVYGARRDNLWLAGKIRRYTGRETPTDKEDAFLIPGYPVTDPVIRARLLHN